MSYQINLNSFNFIIRFQYQLDIPKNTSPITSHASRITRQLTNVHTYRQNVRNQPFIERGCHHKKMYIKHYYRTHSLNNKGRSTFLRCCSGPDIIFRIILTHLERYILVGALVHITVNATSFSTQVVFLRKYILI